MADVTYTPPEGDTSFPQETQQFGYSFVAGQPVAVDKPEHVAKFAGNQFFVVDAGSGTPGDDGGKKAEPTDEQKQKAFDGGKKAAENGKPRSVPPVYRNAPDSWLEGYDSHQS